MVRVGANAQEYGVARASRSTNRNGGGAMTGFVRIAAEGYQTEAALKGWVNATWISLRLFQRRGRLKHLRSEKRKIVIGHGRQGADAEAPAYM
jgi:hypothetical protein